MSLNIKQILDANPELNLLTDGDETHLNHVGCEAGNDTKKRLYVKREGGALLFYCHHCTAGGRRAGPENHIRNRTAGNSVQYTVSLPGDMVYRTDMMNVHASAWLNSAGISDEEVQCSRVGWSDSLSRVVLPVYDYAGTKLVAYQTRRVMPGDNRPKYLTARRVDVKQPFWFGPRHRDTQLVVLTEDVLSAIKVNRLCASVALLGVTMSDELLGIISAHHKAAVIWLDDDNHQVRNAQRNLAKRLHQFMPEVHVMHLSDPKHYATDDIRKYLTSVLAHGKV